ncbi:hypothetical protein NLJ89_g428 [Agrocybe chaxingu]|uniref:DUF7923 domain-containing protein n=1 Tax=Agrocybe chaxingu TaxID=84603 RepID=A0A9W8TG25_9AGAR|nr:hypothetical protein NLJ89_g428 [Agrocybe chaxingu]
MSYETADNQQPICDPSLTSQGRVGICFEQLRGEIITILHNDNNSQETIRRLENELSVYKRAYADLDAERHRFERLKQESDKQKEDLENQLKGHRVVALLDGDGTIFNSQLISQGPVGGRAAAQKLSDSIIQYLVANHGTNQYQLWVYVFLNRRGLGDTFGRVGLVSAKAKFEEFVMGFNQAAERFIMVDVGGAKEAADAKIKALLEEEIRLPQTEKIIFGGCHDNGYATTLRSQITAGFKHKLILLPGYSDMAVGINELNLPSLSVPELFIPQKLAVNPPPTQTIHSSPLPTATQLSPPQVLLDAHMCKPTTSITQQAFEALPFATVEPPEMPTPKEHPLRFSYSSAVQRPPRRPDTPELDSSGSTTSSDDSDESVPMSRPPVTSTKPRRVNPNIVSVSLLRKALTPKYARLPHPASLEA